MECPICSAPDADEARWDVLGSETRIQCKRCGDFNVSAHFLKFRPSKPLSEAQVGKASGWIHDHPGVKLDKGSWESLLALPQPSVGEKADKLLLFYAKKHPLLNDPLKVDYHGEELAACWGANRREFEYLFVSYLINHKNFLKKNGAEYSITPEGWDYLHTLQQTNLESQIGFCAMWFGESVAPLWVEGIEPAIQDAGYKPMRIDKHEHNNRIDDEIISVIKRSKFVVADFTGNRGGVYFEAGYALGMGIPVVWSVRHDELDSVHFDNRQYSFLMWTDETLGEFRARLQYRIEATIGRGPN